MATNNDYTVTQDITYEKGTMVNDSTSPSDASHGTGTDLKNTNKQVFSDWKRPMDLRKLVPAEVVDHYDTIQVTGAQDPAAAPIATATMEISDEIQDKEVSVTVPVLKDDVQINSTLVNQLKNMIKSTASNFGVSSIPDTADVVKGNSVTDEGMNNIISNINSLGSQLDRSQPIDAAVDKTEINKVHPDALAHHLARLSVYSNYSNYVNSAVNPAYSNTVYTQYARYNNLKHYYYKNKDYYENNGYCGTSYSENITYTKSGSEFVPDTWNNKTHNSVTYNNYNNAERSTHGSYHQLI